MSILLAGGAGYIGSHTAVELIKAGYDVVIADNYDNSCPEVINRIEKITDTRPIAYEADVRDTEAMRQVFSENEIDVVIHFAGLKAVGESVEKPIKYYRNNIDTMCSVKTIFAIVSERLLMMIVNDLIDYYKLSLRDVMIFKQRMEKISMNVANGFSQQGKCLSLFIPIITVLDITNQEEKKKFINGDRRVLETICRQVPAIRRMLERFIRVGVNENAFETALNELIKIYENIFKESDNEVSSDYIGAMSPDLKRICINACNGFKG